jgi:hypothetical protein
MTNFMKCTIALAGYHFMCEEVPKVLGIEGLQECTPTLEEKWKNLKKNPSNATHAHSNATILPHTYNEEKRIIIP